MLLLRKMNKKGVSPIIATVLLIAFAIALGAIVMNWGKGFVEETAKDTQNKANLELSCEQQLELNIKTIGQTPKLCYNTTGQYIEVMLENRGTVDVTGMQIMLFDTNEESENLINNSIMIPAGMVTNKMRINHNLTGDIVQIEFVPKITPKNVATAQLCSKNNLVIIDITQCG